MKLGSHSPVLSYLFLRESLPWSLSISLSTLSILANFFFPPLHFLYPISIFGSLCLDSSLSFAFVVVQSLSCVWLCGLHELQLTRLPCPSPSPGAVQTQGHWVDNAIQPSHPLPLSSPFAFSLSQHQGLFQWVGFWHQVAKHWSFRISPSGKYSELFSFRIYCFDLLAVQGTLKSLLQHHTLKASILQSSAFFMVQLSNPYMTTRKNHSFDFGKWCLCFLICCLGLPLLKVFL